MDRQEPCIRILIRCLKWLRIGKIKLWDQSVITSWEIYTILGQGINIIIFNPHFLNCHSAWNQLSVYVFLCSVSLEICCSVTFQRHLRIMSFWTDSCESSLWWRDAAWFWFFFILLFSFSGCVSSQALCLQKVLREGQVHNKCFLAERNSESVLVHQGWLPPEKHKLLVLN